MYINIHHGSFPLSMGLGTLGWICGGKNKKAYQLLFLVPYWTNDCILIWDRGWEMASGWSEVHRLFGDTA